MNIPLRTIIIASLMCLTLNAKTITDAEGKSIILSDNINRVFGSSPPMNYLLYALNPDKMIGLNFKAKNAQNGANVELLNKKFISLPVIGSYHGGGQSINLEVLMKHKPELMLIWQDDMMVQSIKKELKKINTPTLMIPFREVTDMPSAFRLAGNAIGESKRGEILAKYSQNIINEVKANTSKTKPTRYYYAEGLDGLSTECDRSFHVEAINFAGGANIHKCRQSGLLGLEKISFETLMAYDPDVIIVQTAIVYNDIKDDPMWRNLKAVKSGRIYLVPVQPFNWIDRPASFMRVLGIQWLAKILHPQTYKVDLNKRTKEFYDLFLNVKLTDTQTKNILGDK
ncbi:MAG: ABC transporter substrate-binding protein [Campylobacterales bacterium]|nr:ABC transporter substrate-binding protein [Campylobacterales bacterium]